MEPQTTASLRQLPRVAISTLIVVGCPALAVVALSASGVIVSSILLIAIGIALSIVASQAGAAYWKRRRGTEDLLFAELMVWGWLKRRRFERLLADAERLLGSPAGSAEALDPSRRARLLERLSTSLEARDPYTHGHSRRVARHSAAIAAKLDLPREEVARIRSAAAIHDVGKIDIPAEILQKPTVLNEEEYEVVKGHSAAGARMAAPLLDEELTRIIRHHHERLDGGGYPDGLAGEEIPLGARIVAVADTFDALTSERPYRSAAAHQEALGVLAAEAGAQLDGGAVRAFRRRYAGRGPVAVWAVLVNGARQLVQPLIGSGAATAAQVTAASLATVALGSAALPSHGTEPRQGGSLTSSPAAARFATGAPGDAGARQVSVHGDSRGQRYGASYADPRDGTSNRADADSGSADGAGSRSDAISTEAGGPSDTPTTPGPTKPPPPTSSPVDDVVGAVGETGDDAIDSIPPVDVTVPQLPNVESTLP
jgi:HD-GYP domain-containing protein (c-di-GMP phosphodiesterase class II)